MVWAQAARWTVLASATIAAGCSLDTRIIRVLDASAQDAPTRPDAPMDAPGDAPADAAPDDRVDASARDVPTADGADAATDVPPDVPLDTGPSCPAGQAWCDGACRDLRTDVTHCGTCATACEGDRGCSGGVCLSLSQASCTPTRVAGCGVVGVPGARLTLGQSGASEGSPVQPSVGVSPFGIDQYEVTVARFRRYWEAGHPGVPGGAVAYPGGASLPWSGSVVEPVPRSSTSTCTWAGSAGPSDGLPINCVDWYTAQAFCVWDGGRLPTEGEWELASRGTDGRSYPWGDGAPSRELCWALLTPAPDGPCGEEDERFRGGVAPSGAWHLSGNVWEWAADNFEVYGASCWPGTARTDPLCALSPSGERSIRGGGWDNDTAPSVHSAARNNYVATFQRPTVGFRCAR